MAHTAGSVMSMITHRTCSADPTHESAYLAVDQRSHDEVIVIGHKQIAIEFDFMELHSLIQYFFVGNIVFVLMKDCRPKDCRDSKRDTIPRPHPLSVTLACFLLSECLPIYPEIFIVSIKEA